MSSILYERDVGKDLANDCPIPRQRDTLTGQLGKEGGGGERSMRWQSSDSSLARMPSDHAIRAKPHHLILCWSAKM